MYSEIEKRRASRSTYVNTVPPSPKGFPYISTCHHYWFLDLIEILVDLRTETCMKTPLSILFGP